MPITDLPIPGGTPANWGGQLNLAIESRRQYLQDQIDAIVAGYVAYGSFLPETYGAVGDGITDDTVAIQDAMDAAYAAGGGSVLLTKRYGWRGDLKHRGTINVCGVSVRKELLVDDDMDRGLVALDGTARYFYGQWAGVGDSTDDNPGGLYNVIIDGNDVGGAVDGLFIMQCVDGYIGNPRIVRSAGNCVLADGTQNSKIEGGLVGQSAGKAIALSRIDDTGQGAGNVKFNAVYVATSGKLVYADSDPANFWPHDIYFTECLFENYDPGNDLIHQRAGEIQYTRCVVTNSNDGSTPIPLDCLVLVEQDIWPTIPTQATFTSCSFNGGGGGGPTHLVRAKTVTGVGVGNFVRFYGKTEFANADHCVGLDGGSFFSSYVTIDGDVFRNGSPVPEWYDEINGATSLNIQRRTPMPTRWEMPDDPGSGFLPNPLSTKREGEDADRWRLDRDGTHRWLDGVDNADTKGSLGYDVATDQMQMGGVWNISNSWVLRQQAHLITTPAQAVALSAAKTSAPAALLAFFASTSADITLDDGVDGAQFQIMLYAPAQSDTSVTWPSNIHFRGPEPQVPPAGGILIVDLVMIEGEWYAKDDQGQEIWRRDILLNAIPNLESAGAWANFGAFGFSSAGASSTPYSDAWYTDIGPGTWAIEINTTTGPNAGIVTFEYSLDGGATWTALATNVDQYTASSATQITAATGIAVEKAGRFDLRIRSTGTKNGSSTGYYFFGVNASLRRTA